MVNDQTIRLELLKLVVPQASRVGLSEPENIISTCSALEKYVIGSQQVEGTPDSTTRRPGRPRKEKPSSEVPGFLDPTHGGQVESSDR